jgi:DNA-binding MarR family transcriptional regulator
MREVDRLFSAIELFRKRVNKDMPIQHVTLLLAVARNPGITMPELISLLKMPQGSVSRNIKVLSDYVERENGVSVMKGYCLLRTRPVPYNRRVLAVYLTLRGEALIQDLTRMLTREQGNGWGDESAGLKQAAGFREMVTQ